MCSCGLRFDPDGVGVGAEEIVGFGFGDDTAADGENAVFVFAHDAFERAAFDGAIAGLTVERKNVGEGHAGFFFDFTVEFDEGDVAVRQRVFRRAWICRRRGGRLRRCDCGAVKIHRRRHVMGK